MNNRDEMNSVVSRIKKAGLRLRHYADTYERSGVVNIKHLQLLKDEVNELNEALDYWLLFSALGGDVDNE